MGYRQSLLCAILITGLVVSGCSGRLSEVNSPESIAAANSSSIAAIADPSSNISETQVPNNYTEHIITFPVSDRGKTNENAAGFDIMPFDISFVLPKGWTMQEAAIQEIGKFSPHYLNYLLWSIVDIFDDTGECVGAIGYNTYELYEGAEDNPQAIYGWIALGNGYHFDAQEAYTPVATTDAMSTAMTDVLYSASFLSAADPDDLININKGLLSPDNSAENHYREDEGYARINKGILSCNKDFLVYIAAELDRDMITNEQLQTIAQSIHFPRSN